VKFAIGPSQTYVRAPTRIRLWLNYHTDRDTGKTASAAAKNVYWEIFQIISMPLADDEVWISTKRLMLMCNLQERSVQRSIAWLVKNGALLRHEHIGHGVVYELAPATFHNDDYQAMRAAGFCPCKWNGRCRRHPPKLTRNK